MTKHALAKRRRSIAERQRRSVQRMVRPLFVAGNLLSNICFNAKQCDQVPIHIRKAMADVQAQWDAALPAARRAIGL